MKLRSTTPVSVSLVSRASLVAMSVLLAGSGVFGLASHVLARDYNAEIQAKQKEAESYNSEASRLGQMADSLQSELDKINGQIAAIQAQISDSQTKINNLNDQIKKNEASIKQNRKAMGRILADLYVDDQISPLEMLASSKNISDYIDKQEQRSSLKSSLNDKIKEIKSLQKKLEENKKSVENTLRDQELQRNAMASKQSEKAKLIADTKNDQNNYAALAQKRNAEVAKLREEQAAVNLKALGRSGVSIPGGIPGGGGYPGAWASAPLDAYVDPWGLYTRECVSYVAWKIHSTGRYVPHFGGAGDANQWPSTAARHGISNGSTPKAGSAAVFMEGEYGHVMYVESVNGDGTITVSDYNLKWDGLYRYYTRSASGLTYVYF
ncbi:CHAP domain-containing protein [Candidatus Nanosynbacter sp. TM7-074]|uniref:CHAP domain-containing protein n=1 Tax=Candidatus Nanosynbacter sp. TM7-074 TaxID=3158573 RepID=A0AB39J4C8_9BACT